MSIELLADLDRDGGWTLLVDGAEQSYVDVNDPTHLEFEYMQHFALVADASLPRPTAITAAHLGGGALTMPRWIAATRPGSTQVVVESSRAILDAVRPLGDVAGCRLESRDARDALWSWAPDSYDLVIWDLYEGPRAVTAMLDVDVISRLRTAARTTGLVLLNVSDVAPFDVVRPVVAGLRQRFDDVVMLAEPSIVRGRRSGNCVLAASPTALPTSGIIRAAAAAPARARVISGEDLVSFVGDAVPPTVDAPLPPPDEASGRAFL